MTTVNAYPTIVGRLRRTIANVLTDDQLRNAIRLVVDRGVTPSNRYTLRRYRTASIGFLALAPSVPYFTSEGEPNYSEIGEQHREFVNGGQQIDSNLAREYSSAFPSYNYATDLRHLTAAAIGHCLRMAARDRNLR
jgi:hypothetical protein